MSSEGSSKYANKTSFTRDNNPRTNLSELQRRQIAIDVEKVRRGGFSAFIPMAWKFLEPAVTYNGNWHVDAIGEALMATYRGEIRQLIVNIPPGCMKSRLVCALWPSYVWAIDPGVSWLFVSYNHSEMVKQSSASLQLMQSPWYRQRWGNKFSVREDAAQGTYRNSHGGERESTSMNGKITGKHPDIVVIDDPMKAKDMSTVALENVKSIWNGTLSTRARNPMTIRRVCIMQRLHMNDLAGALLEEGGWEHLSLPMEFEERTRCTLSTGWTDPRKQENELLWPTRFDAEYVKGLKIKLTPIHAASQLQQRPTMEQGNIFDRTWFNYYDPKELPVLDQMLMSWDMTFKEGDRTDYVVGQVWGRRGGDFYLLDEYRKQMSFVDTVKAVKELKQRWKRVSAILIEDKANGPAVYSVLQKEVPGVIMLTPEGGKESRANAASSFFQAQNVHLPNPQYKREDDFLPYEWVREYVEELANFPTGRYDDRVDSTSQALIWMGQKRSSLSAAMASLRKQNGGLNNPFR